MACQKVPSGKTTLKPRETRRAQEEQPTNIKYKVSFGFVNKQLE
jgi:hypothetical protein